MKPRGSIHGAPLRIAMIATLAFTVAYVLVAVGAVVSVWSNGVTSVDQSLYGFEQDLQMQARVGGTVTLDARGQLLVAWEGNDEGVVQPAHGTPYPEPPPLTTGVPTTSSLGGTPYRLLKFEVPNLEVSWIVVGESLAPIYAGTLRVAGEATLVAPFLLAVVFFGAWWIGRSAAAPAIRARQRELAFTADASHELRTPLQVIEAESSLALMRDRPADDYRGTIERISGESRRLRSIVDDLFWLARVEEHPPGDQQAPVDMRAVVRTTEERFASVAERRRIRLEGHVVPGDTPMLVLGSVEWLERLAGVLVDNAIRYTPDGGHIDLWTSVRSGRVVLGIADTGPGFTPEQAQHIFERFHRASDAPGGAGLGLAIADSVVRATGGQWAVGRSQQLGGAQFEVSWPVARANRPLEATSATSA